MVAIPGGDAHQNQTRIDDDGYMDGLSKMAETVHKNGDGCRIFAQLSHAGPNGILDPISSLRHADATERPKNRAFFPPRKSLI